MSILDEIAGTVHVSPKQSNSSGYTCMFCNQWVNEGEQHWCLSPFTTGGSGLQDSGLQKVANALERIADALEQISLKL